MSGIVIQLQEEALSKGTDILSLMRKAYFIARKLKLQEFQKWIEYEQNGYPAGTEVPDYRKIVGEIKAWNPYHGWIPAIFEKTTPFHEHDVRDAVASLVNIILNSEGGTCMFIFPSELSAYLSSLGSDSSIPTKFSLHVSMNVIYNIIEQVRNKILDWAITLEENGIIGEGLQFSTDEKKKALNTPGIANYTNNFYGNVTKLQLQQDTQNSSQSIEN